MCVQTIIAAFDVCMLRVRVLFIYSVLLLNDGKKAETEARTIVSEVFQLVTVGPENFLILIECLEHMIREVVIVLLLLFDFRFRFTSFFRFTGLSSSLNAHQSWLADPKPYDGLNLRNYSIGRAPMRVTGKLIIVNRFTQRASITFGTDPNFCQDFC